MCHVSENYFMNNFGLYPSAAKSGHVWQKNARRNARAVRWEGAGLKHRARCGLVARMKVTGQVLLPRETYTVHYTVKRKVWAGLKPIWLVQVWRQRYLESIVLDLRVRTYPSIWAFTQKDWNPPTLFFNITSSGPYPCSILTDQSSFIVLSKRHPLSSPTQFHGCDSSGVCDRGRSSRSRRRRTSAAARPPRRGPPALPRAVAFGLGEAATRLAPRVKAWANETWKIRKLRKLRIPKIS